MKKAIVAASCAAVISFAAPVNAGGFSNPIVEGTTITVPADPVMVGGMSSGSTALVAGIAVLLLAAGLSSSSGT